MSDDAGKPVPTDKLPGAEVPNDKLPMEMRAPVAEPAHEKTPEDPPTPKLGPIASAIVRPIAKGAVGAIMFIPDMATDLVNLIPESVLGPKDREFTSDEMMREIDKRTTESKGLGRVAEEISTALIGGGVMKAGERALGLTAKEAAAPRAFSRVTTRAAQQAHQVGYKLPPSYVGGVVSRTAQDLAGRAKVEIEMSAANEHVTDRLGKAAIGLGADEELSDAALEHLKEEAYRHYEAVRSLGPIPSDEEWYKELREAGGRFANRAASYKGARFPEVTAEKQPYLDAITHNPSEMLDEIRTLRRLSSQNLKQYDPAKNAVGYTQREIANAMENLIERHAGANGQPEIVNQLKAARAQLAKIATVEDSIGAGGHIRASDIWRLWKKGAPLDDSFKTIARAYNEFPKAMQEATKKGGHGVWSAVDYLLGGTGIIEGSPSIAALSVARPVTRAALGTERIQRSMIEGMTERGPAAKAVRSTAAALPGVAARGSAIEGETDR